MARRLPLLALALLTASAVLLEAAPARAGTGLGPDGTVIDVSTDGAGSIRSPAGVDLTVALDVGDRDPTVWVSTSPERTAAGVPGAIGFCDADTLRAGAAPGTFTCSVPALRLRPGGRYYWWLVFVRTDDSGLEARQQVSGPFSFSLHDTSRPERKPVSRRTFESAARLPSRARFDGTRSIKDTTLGAIVARTMRASGHRPLTLAVACWTDRDFASALASVGEPRVHGSSELLGIWRRAQPHWLHLAARPCAEAQRLLDTGTATGRNAEGLVLALHEALHAYGVVDEAEANCLAVQLIPLAAGFAGLPRRRAIYLGELALRYTRAYAPDRYWDSGRCRAGGAWDLAAQDETTR